MDNKHYHDQYMKYKQKYISNKTDIDNRIYGVIYGVIYGDSFGARYEFTTRDAAQTMIEDDKVGNTYPIKGGGFFEVAPGQVTDDSEMMFGLLESLIENSGYNQQDVALKYIRWFDTNPVDRGETIKRALCTRKKAENSKDMTDNSLEMNSGSLSNGSLMRIAPLGIYGLVIDNKHLKELVKQECMLTHPNEIVVDICYVYCLACKYAILGYDKDIIYKKILKAAEHPRTKIVLREAQYSSEPVYIIDGYKETYIYTDNKKFQGYIGIALQNAIYELLNTSDPSVAIVNVAKRGGDTDTNCAITGGLLGGYYGKNMFSKEWYNTVETTSTSLPRVKSYPFLNPIKYMTDCCNSFIKMVNK